MDLWVTIGMIAVVVVVFYFFGIRPQKKQDAERKNLLEESFIIYEFERTLRDI